MLCLRILRVVYVISTITVLIPSVVFADRSDIGPMRARRSAQIVDGTAGASSVASWTYSLRSDGTWADVDYTTGCSAARASWPAASHWSRINTLAAAWHGGLEGALQYAGDPDVRNSVASAMKYWFDHDFTNARCLDSGGNSACPCGTAGLWNQNWYSNIILIPAWVAQSCLLLGEELTGTEYAGCKRIAFRAFNTFYTGINNVPITGANLMDIASIGIDYALLAWDEGVIVDAFNRVHGELEVKNTVKADGVRDDGSFGFHSGVLYNGNYGKDYANDVLSLELVAGGTEYAATGEAQSALVQLLEASRWMSFLNTKTGVVHWDYPALGRMISIPVADNQASSGLKMDLSQIQALGDQWNSGDLKVIYDALSDTYASSASQGVTYGNKMFYNNDYMVHRGSRYVTSLKMYSSRTLNAECVNSQNRKGFHLSDGALYTYVTGNEYEDIFASCISKRAEPLHRHVGG